MNGVPCFMWPFERTNVDLGLDLGHPCCRRESSERERGKRSLSLSPSPSVVLLAASSVRPHPPPLQTDQVQPSLLDPNRTEQADDGQRGQRGEKKRRSEKSDKFGRMRGKKLVGLGWAWSILPCPSRKRFTPWAEGRREGGGVGISGRNQEGWLRVALFLPPSLLCALSSSLNSSPSSPSKENSCSRWMGLSRVMLPCETGARMLYPPHRPFQASLLCLPSGVIHK